MPFFFIFGSLIILVPPLLPLLERGCRRVSHYPSKKGLFLPCSQVHVLFLPLQLLLITCTFSFCFLLRGIYLTAGDFDGTSDRWLLAVGCFVPGNFLHSRHWRILINIQICCPRLSRFSLSLSTHTHILSFRFCSDARCFYSLRVPHRFADDSDTNESLTGRDGESGRYRIRGGG